MHGTGVHVGGPPLSGQEPRSSPQLLLGSRAPLRPTPPDALSPASHLLLGSPVARLGGGPQMQTSCLLALLALEDYLPERGG